MEQIAIHMIVPGVQGEDSQWFDYRPGYFADIVRVEWDKDTSLVSLQKEVADYLVRNGYARLATEDELPKTVNDPPLQAKEEVDTKPEEVITPPADDPPPQPEVKVVEPPPPPPKKKEKSK